MTPLILRKTALAPTTYINGRFLTQAVSGVQRYAREVVAALDRMLDTTAPGATHWVLLCPPGAKCDLPLRNIEVRAAGPFGGHLWEQMVLPLYARGPLLSLCNSGPILHLRQLVVIHDAAVFRTPDNFSPRYAAFHRLLGRLLARTARRIGTVSQFSRRELAEVLAIPAERIVVACNGAEHLRDAAADEGVLDRLDLVSRRFFLFVGSPTPNKNLITAVEAFNRLGDPDARLVLVGARAKGVFGDAADPSESPGVIRAGRLTDPEITALYRHAAALVFPSLYEGFGIPLLEALVNGCPVIASDIPPTREVCGNAATYFPPLDVEALVGVMGRQTARGMPQNEHSTVLTEFSWPRAAFVLRNAASDSSKIEYKG